MILVAVALAIIIIITRYSCQKRQGASCRQAARKGCQVSTPCWTRQIQARPSQPPWARCSVFVPAPASRGPPCCYYYHYYYYTPIQATVGLGASQQRFYDSLPIRPILAPFPPCQGQPKTVQVFPDTIIPRLYRPTPLASTFQSTEHHHLRQSVISHPGNMPKPSQSSIAYNI
jgi:hypothetical protein